MTKMRLPLPKNMVLMSLIEASEMAMQTTRQLRRSSSSAMYGDPTMSTDDEEEEENSKIMMSMDLATSSCGTYAVATKAGLTIYSSMDDVDESSRRLFGDDPLLDGSLMRKRRSSLTEKWKQQANRLQQPREMQLNYGDR